MSGQGRRPTILSASVLTLARLNRHSELRIIPVIARALTRLRIVEKRFCKEMKFVDLNFH